MQAVQVEDNDDNQEGTAPKLTPWQWKSARLTNAVGTSSKFAILHFDIGSLALLLSHPVPPDILQKPWRDAVLAVAAGAVVRSHCRGGLADLTLALILAHCDLPVVMTHMQLPWNLSPIGYLVLAALPHGSHLAEVGCRLTRTPPSFAFSSPCLCVRAVGHARAFGLHELLHLPQPHPTQNTVCKGDHVCLRTTHLHHGSSVAVCCCVLQSYNMHAGRQTHAIALLFNAAYVCRLQVVVAHSLNNIHTRSLTQQHSHSLAHQSHHPPLRLACPCSLLSDSIS